MFHREKRGKLSALYSVEDDNEITFDVPSESSESVTTITSTTTVTEIREEIQEVTKH